MEVDQGRQDVLKPYYIKNVPAILDVFDKIEVQDVAFYIVDFGIVAVIKNFLQGVILGVMAKVPIQISATYL